MNKRIFSCVLACVWLVSNTSVQAHHSLAGVYDIRKEGQLTGTLTKIAFTNTLANLGFGQGGGNNVNAGDTVTAVYFPARNGSPLGRNHARRGNHSRGR